MKTALLWPWSTQRCLESEMSIELDLDWIGSGLLQILLNLDWIQAVNHFKTLDPDRIWTELMEKKRSMFW